MSSPGYLAPESAVRAELRERGSVFLAEVAPATSEAEAQAVVAALAREFPDATHVCWAWRLGAAPAERWQDAGEPAGTAGQPILQVLRGAGLSDAVAAVVRWYGGVKLGKGGLARAYAAAARAAALAVPARRRVPVVRLALEVPYERLGAVKRLLRPPEVELAAQEYGERVRLVLAVHADRREALVADLADLGVAPSPVPARGGLG